MGHEVNYDDFIAAKGASAPPTGIEDVGDLGDHLFPFQSDLTAWALRRGKAALFEAVGLGKTRQQLTFAVEASRHLARKGQPSKALVLTPLAVAAQTVREADEIGFDAKYCREPSEQVDGAITVTNYDRLDKFNPAEFGIVVLDESSVIKHHDSATRTKIIDAFEHTPFRLACTATPAPNDRKELGNHSEFLGVLTLQEMLSEFFVHDSGKTSQWRLKGHAERHFWRWVASWGAMVTKPSDLGYEDAGYNLPPLTLIDHVVPATLAHGMAITKERCKACEGEGKVKATDEQIEAGSDALLECEDCGGEGAILLPGTQLCLPGVPRPASSLIAQRKARRATLDERVKMAVDVIMAEPAEQWIIWCELNKEAEALHRALTKLPGGAVEIRGNHKPDVKEKAMLGFASGSIRRLITKPSIAGYGLNWQSCARACFVGASHSFEDVHQALGRNHRFGQKREVRAHMVYSELEGPVRANLERKRKEFAQMAEAMRGIVAGYVKQNVLGSGRGVTPYEPTVPMRIPAWLRSENAA